jgi:hypothetical protein
VSSVVGPDRTVVQQCGRNDMKEAHRRTVYLLVVLAGVLVATALASGHFGRPRGASLAASTNVVLQLSQVTSRAPVPEESQFRFEGVEPAERINQELMRRSREEWERTHKLQLPR